MKIVYATSTTSVALAGGGSGLVEHGTHWPADDPIVLAHRDLFSDDPRYGMRYSVEPDGYNDPLVEQASAAPGERRATRRG